MSPRGDLTAALQAVCTWATATGSDLGDLTVTRRTLEDAYLELIA